MRGKFQPRGRFLIVVPYEQGYIRIESPKDKSLTPDEIRRDLLKYADYLKPVKEKSA